MDSLYQSLSASAPQWILLLFGLVIVLAGSLFVLSRRVRKMNARWKDLMDGVKGDNLERLLYDHLRERMQIQSDLGAISDRVEVLEVKMKSAKRHLGLVKFDAFDDVGGSQSFALALYDDQGDGALITSQVGRSDCRVYSKPLLNGKSERSLSQEEQRAIKEAVQTGPKSIVSHS